MVLEPNSYIEFTLLIAELLRYKKAVHRQLHSNSTSTDSPVDIGLIIRIPRSNDSVFEEENKTSVRSKVKKLNAYITV